MSGGYLSGGYLSGGYLSGGYLSGRYLSGGICPAGICPDTKMLTLTYKSYYNMAPPYLCELINKKSYMNTRLGTDHQYAAN